MSFVPKYQWLTEYTEPKCGGCDIVQIDTTAEKKFQVAFTPTEVVNENFNGNNIALPMEQIWVGLGSLGSGSGTGLYYGITFDIDIINEDRWVNSFSFIYEGTPYCYLFTIDTTFPPGYEVVEYGNFNLVKFESALDYVDTLNTILNQFGISAIDNGGNSITVYGFPEDTQVTTNDTVYYQNTITEGVGTATWQMDNFIPIANKICFFQISNLDEQPNSNAPTGTPSIWTENHVISANKRMIFTINFTNSFSTEITLYLYIRDNTFGLIDTLSAVAKAGTNTLTFNYTTGVTPPTSYTFQFLIDAIGSEIEDSQVGFCFNSVKIETIERLENIDIVGCTTENVTFTEEYNDLYNSLITMNTGSLPNGLFNTGKWQIVLTDDESNTFTSIMYESITGTNCLTSNLFRLKWWNDCMFGNLDYANLPFVNDVYVKGYEVSQPLDSKDRVVNTLSDGSLELIYDYSLEKKEFNIGIYTESFFRTLQRAFIHKYITIDGIYYKQDSDSILAKKPEGKKYSGRIELVESGSEVIITNCCC